MIYKTYKYRIYPTKDQANLFEKHFGCSRWIYNYGLEKKIQSYQVNKVSLSRFDIQKELPKLKRSEETKWLKEVNSQTLQASLENLDKAFTSFFKKKCNFPKFKNKKSSYQRFCVPQKGVVDFNNNAILLPKFKKPIKCKLHRIFDGISKRITITKTPTGKYFASVLVEINGFNAYKKPIDEKKAIGIDLGISTFATMSDGTKIENPKNIKKNINKLKKLHRKLSKKTKGSNNRNKARVKLAKLHEKIANKRNDFIQKTTKYIIDNYDTICLETLRPANMIKNHCLAQSISDISIGVFNKTIEYKSSLYGLNIIRIGQFEPSSKMCSCGVINKDLKLSNRTWTCSNCSVTHDRDLLAANNIKKFAFAKIQQELLEYKPAEIVIKTINETGSL